VNYCWSLDCLGGGGTGSWDTRRLNAWNSGVSTIKR
jgi:hypothetical protein